MDWNSLDDDFHWLIRFLPSDYTPDQIETMRLIILVGTLNYELVRKFLGDRDDTGIAVLLGTKIPVVLPQDCQTTTKLMGNEEEGGHRPVTVYEGTFPIEECIESHEDASCLAVWKLFHEGLARGYKTGP
jgi:hypothetical protein